jgi:hypothetical protein
MDLKISPEFEHLLPSVDALTDEELEKQLLETGYARNPIVAWNGTIIDGHRRYKLCKKHNLPFQVDEMGFKTTEEAKAWAFSDQIARRNVSTNERSICIARLAELRSGGKGVSLEAAKEVAAKAGVTTRSVYRAAEFAKAVDSLPEDISEKVISGKLDVSQRDVTKLAKMPEKQQREAVKEIEAGKKPLTPRKKPDEDAWHEVEWRLVELKRATDDLGDLFPGPRYQRLMKHLDKAGEELAAWKGEDK